MAMGPMPSWLHSTMGRGAHPSQSCLARALWITSEEWEASGTGWGHPSRASQGVSGRDDMGRVGTGTQLGNGADQRIGGSVTLGGSQIGWKWGVRCLET